MGVLPIEVQLPIRTILRNKVGQLGVTLGQGEGGIPRFPRFHLIGLGLPCPGTFPIHLRIPTSRHRGAPFLNTWRIVAFRPTGQLFDYISATDLFGMEPYNGP